MRDIKMHVQTALIFLGSLASTGLAGTVTGHVRDVNGTGIMDVDLDFFSVATGAKLVTPNDCTGVGGSFSVVVPDGVYRVTFDPSAVTGATYAPKQLLQVVVSGNTLIGNIILSPGIVITGKVTGTGGSPVADADLDFIRSSDGITMFTPKDNTDAAGNFKIVTEPGSYFVKVQPPVATKLLNTKTGPLQMSSSLSLGTLSVPPGVVLSGTVTTTGGGPIAGADIDVVDLGTGLTVPLLGDITDSSGHYQSIVPAGSIQVTIHAPANSIFDSVTVPMVQTPGDTTLDVTLPLASAATDPTPTTVNFGDTFTGSFQSTGEVDEIRFTGLAGQAISIDARKITNQARPAFQLISPGSVPLAMGNAYTNTPLGSGLKKFALPETGAYRVMVFPATGATPGNYKVKITATTPPSLKSPKTTGVIANSGDHAPVLFIAPAGAVLKGTLVPSKGSPVKPVPVGLSSPSLAPLDFPWVPTGATGKVTLGGTGILLPETGTYTLQVGDAAALTGAFVAQLKLIFPAHKPAIVPET
jgi:hypothetical protein